jgi:hypothetical protein
MRLARVVAIPLLGALAAGCGGGSGSSATSTAASGGGTTRHASTATAKPPPRRAKARKKATPKPATPATPQATVETAFTSDGAGACALYTPRLLARSYGGLQGCESAVSSGGRASSVDVTSTQPDGARALVVAVPRGGPSSGERLRISLVRQGGGWRLDSIHSNVPVGP